MIQVLSVEALPAIGNMPLNIEAIPYKVTWISPAMTEPQNDLVYLINGQLATALTLDHRDYGPYGLRTIIDVREATQDNELLTLIKDKINEETRKVHAEEGQKRDSCRCTASKCRH